MVFNRIGQVLSFWPLIMAHWMPLRYVCRQVWGSSKLMWRQVQQYLRFHLYLLEHLYILIQHTITQTNFDQNSCVRLTGSVMSSAWQIIEDTKLHTTDHARSHACARHVQSITECIYFLQCQSSGTTTLAFQFASTSKFLGVKRPETDKVPHSKPPMPLREFFCSCWNVSDHQTIKSRNPFEKQSYLLSLVSLPISEGRA